METEKLLEFIEKTRTNDVKKPPTQEEIFGIKEKKGGRKARQGKTTKLIRPKKITLKKKYPQ